MSHILPEGLWFVDSPFSSIVKFQFFSQFPVAQSTETVEYIDCISAEGQDIS